MLIFRLLLIVVIILTVLLVAHNAASHWLGGMQRVIEITEEDLGDPSESDGESDEIIIDDTDLGRNTSQTDTTGKSREDKPLKGADGSEILTMYDGHGNKTETRSFFNHARIRMVMVRTDTKGLRRVFVYGHNGKVKSVPEEMFDRVLSATGDELANAAQIYETKADRERQIADRRSRRSAGRAPTGGNGSFPTVRQPGFDQSGSSGGADTRETSGASDGTVQPED